MIAGGLQGLHFVNTMSNADLKRKAAEAEGIIGAMGRNIGKLAPFAPLAAGGLILAKLSDDAYDFSNEYSKAMREVQTISKATQRDWEGMNKSIIDLAANGPDDAIQLAQAYYQIASAGYDGAAGLNLLDVASRAATAGITDTKTAADGLTTILNAWGKDATEAEHVADVLFKTVEKGKTTFPELAQNIATVAPMASAMNISLEEITGSIATLTKQGNTTPVALTQIRQAIIGLNENLGDGWSEAMTFQEALQQVRDMAGGSDTKLKEMMGRVEGMNAVLSLTGDKALEAASDLDTMTTAVGSMQTAYETMMLEADNKWSQVHNKWQRELSQVGDKLKVASSGIADFFNRILTDEQADVIGPASQSAINNLFSDLNQLDDKEAKLKLITDKIIELKNEYVSLGQESAHWEKGQPSWLQRQAENFNAALGFGPATMPGRYNQANLEIVQKDIAINEQVSQKLEELYRQVLNSAGGSSGSGGGGGGQAKPWTVGESQAEIERLKEQLGTVSIEQEVELRFKIADEQAKVDEFYTKVRDRFNQAINESWEAPFNRTVDTEGANTEIASRGDASKMISDQAEAYRQRLKETTKLLKPLQQLTDEESEQLRIEEEKIKIQLQQIENQEELAKAMYDSSEILGALSYAIGEVDSEAGKAVGRLADMARNASNMIASFSSQDYLSAAASGIGLIGNILGSVSTSRSDKLADALDNINESLERQATLLAALNGEDWFEAAGKQAQRLREDIDELTETLLQYTLVPREIAEQYRNAADQRGGEALADMYGIDTTGWSLDDILKALNGDYDFLATEKMYGDVNNLLTTILNLRSELDSISNDSVFDKLGFNTEDISSILSDGITQGLKLSEGGLGDFADSFKKQLNDAILQAVLGPQTDQQIQAYMEKMRTYADIEEDGSMFSDQEKAELEDLYRTLIENTQRQADELGFMADDSAGGYAEAQGIQRSITEETGTLLVGQFTSMRDYQVRANDTMMDQLAMAEEQLEVLQDIRDNTSYNHNLEGMHEELRTMNQTLKTGLSV